MFNLAVLFTEATCGQKNKIEVAQDTDDSGQVNLSPTCSYFRVCETILSHIFVTYMWHTLLFLLPLFVLFCFATLVLSVFMGEGVGEINQKITVLLFFCICLPHKYTVDLVMCAPGYSFLLVLPLPCTKQSQSRGTTPHLASLHPLTILQSH